MKAFSAKTILSVVATTIIVSGLAYAANINSVATQTVNSGDTMGPGWFQMVNDKILNMPSAQQGSVLYAKSLTFSSAQSWNDTMNAYVTAYPGTSWADAVQEYCMAPDANTLPAGVATTELNKTIHCMKVACIQKGFQSVVSPGFEYCAKGQDPKCSPQFLIVSKCISAQNESVINY